jgi:hypothetical protein
MLEKIPVWQQNNCTHNVKNGVKIPPDVLLRHGDVNSGQIPRKK